MKELIISIIMMIVMVIPFIIVYHFQNKLDEEQEEFERMMNDWHKEYMLKGKEK